MTNPLSKDTGDGGLKGRPEHQRQQKNKIDGLGDLRLVHKFNTEIEPCEKFKHHRGNPQQEKQDACYKKNCTDRSGTIDKSPFVFV